MIEYILISYVIMFAVAFCCVVFDGEDLKPNFKWWVLSPVSMPLFLVGLFVNW